MKNGFTRKNSLAPLGRGLGRGVKAFTLAEVLITLGVIGVVAAMTMPTLIQNYKKHVAINKLKTTFTILNNALEMAKSEYGLDVNQWAIPTESEDSSSSDYFAEHYLLPYLKVVKDCKGNNTDAICNPKRRALNSSVSTTSINDRVFVLPNGVIVCLSVENFKRIQITFFINGNRDTNVNAKDVFRIELGGGLGGPDKNKFYPYGYNSGVDCKKYLMPEYSSNACSIEKTGEMCLAPIYCSGWQIPDGYPIRF